jgi:hypothetical protein
VHAKKLEKEGNREAAALADLFCRAAHVRVKQLFAGFYGDYDAAMYRVAQQVMRGEHAWLETGIVSMLDDEAGEASLTGTPAPSRETVGAA